MIYPAYDPVYWPDIKKDVLSSGSSSKEKRAHVRGYGIKRVYSFTTREVVLVRLMAELLAVQRLTDTAIFQLSSVGVAPYFVEKIQNCCSPP